MVWRGQSDSEIQTEGLHSVNGTPIIVGDHVYGVCSYGQFRCLKAQTGERVWESQALTKERTRWASAFIVRHGERLFINNDRGELIIVTPSPEGYKEISRTQSDQADHGAKQPAGAGRPELVRARLRQQAHLRAQR